MVVNNKRLPFLPTRFGFFLINQFTLLSLASMIEPLRMANRIQVGSVYSWKMIGESGDSVAASDGLEIKLDATIEDRNVLDNIDILIICSGAQVEKETSRAVIKWIKMADKKGLALGSVCTGTYVLAKAGLLDDTRCSVHWENISSIAEEFPKAIVSRSLFSMDKNRYTSSGGISPIDLSLYFVTEQFGLDVASDIADQFIHERIRQGDENQRIPLRHRKGKFSNKLTTAVELMEANIRDEISQEDVAQYAGLSRRQLQRLFQHYLGCTPTRYYQQLKLQRARELLQQTNKSLIEISQLTGFVSTSHFSKSYKKHFGHSPSTERQ